MSNRRPPPLALAPRPRVVGSPGFASVLSGLLPGLGQIYQGRWVKGRTHRDRGRVRAPRGAGYEALSDNVDPDALINRVLERIPVPVAPMQGLVAVGSVSTATAS